jgi:YggT family protein
VARHPPAEANLIPYNSLAHVVIVEGGLNFLALYQGILTLSILLSWFPQSRGVGVLQPVFNVSDVYLNLFRGIIPAIGGLDLSPILAFFLLNFAQSAIASL